MTIPYAVLTVAIAFSVSVISAAQPRAITGTGEEAEKIYQDKFGDTESASWKFDVKNYYAKGVNLEPIKYIGENEKGPPLNVILTKMSQKPVPKLTAEETAKLGAAQDLMKLAKAPAGKTPTLNIPFGMVLGTSRQYLAVGDVVSAKALLNYGMRQADLLKEPQIKKDFLDYKNAVNGHYGLKQEKN